MNPKKILILACILFIFTPSSLFAKCMSGTTWASPDEDVVLPSNAVVLVSFMGSDQKKFEKKASKKLFFRSGKHHVEGKIRHTFKSEFSQTIVLIQAKAPLKTGRTYSLNINGKRFKWKVGEKDNTAPKWKKAPKMSTFSKVEFGCGPAVNYELSIQLEDKSALFFDVKMQSEDGKEQHFFITSLDKKTLKIGHGMCSGAFVPPQNNAVTVAISPYDFAGNKGETRTIKLLSK